MIINLINSLKFSYEYAFFFKQINQLFLTKHIHICVVKVNVRLDIMSTDRNKNLQYKYALGKKINT